MNTTELHNSYKCFDSIPTPPDGSKQCNDYNYQPSHAFTSQNTSNLLRSASLDSLINSSEQDSSLDELSDSDSLSELKNIAPYETKPFDELRKSDIEELKNTALPKEPVIKAYLEKSHKSCDYENCVFKKDSKEKEKSKSATDESSPTAVNPSKPFSLSIPLPKLNRRNSIANADSVQFRMETILEEPIEQKISVKEILARFETMRETAEVKSSSRVDIAEEFCSNENFVEHNEK